MKSFVSPIPPEKLIQSQEEIACKAQQRKSPASLLTAERPSKWLHLSISPSGHQDGSNYLLYEKLASL